MALHRIQCLAAQVFQTQAARRLLTTSRRAPLNLLATALLRHRLHPRAMTIRILSRACRVSHLHRQALPRALQCLRVPLRPRPRLYNLISQKTTFGNIRAVGVSLLIETSGLSISPSTTPGELYRRVLLLLLRQATNMPVSSMAENVMLRTA